MRIVDNNTSLVKQQITPEEFDDAVVRGCTLAHIESMSKRHVYIGLFNEFNDDDAHVCIQITATKKGKIKVFIHK